MSDLWKQDYFAALAGFDQFKSLGKVFEGEGMGEDGADIEAGFEAVSYTHLDVYKRQVRRHGASDRGEREQVP